jgi:hypothetical protein
MRALSDPASVGGAAVGGRHAFAANTLGRRGAVAGFSDLGGWRRNDWVGGWNSGWVDSGWGWGSGLIGFAFGVTFGYPYADWDPLFWWPWYWNSWPPVYAGWYGWRSIDDGYWGPSYASYWGQPYGYRLASASYCWPCTVSYDTVAYAPAPTYAVAAYDPGCGGGHYVWDDTLGGYVYRPFVLYC